jgi:biotin carboxyl carrier protein
LNESRPNLDDLHRIVDILRSAQHCSGFRFQQGDCLIEVDADGLRAPAEGGAPCVDAGVGPAPVAAVPDVAMAAPTILNVVAPGVGLLHRGQMPENASPVAVGDRVSAGDVLAAIDVLGEFLPVIAPADGRIVGMLVEDRAAVGYGQCVALLQTD